MNEQAYQMLLMAFNQLADRVGKLESNQFYLLITTTFSLLGIVINLVILLAKRKLKRNENGG